MSSSSFHKVGKFIWPQRLRYQLALIIVAIISASIISFTWHLSDEESEAITQELRQHTAVLAENIATASAQYLLVRDYTSIENILIGAAKFPGITHIEVSDIHGKIIGAVNKNENGRIEALYGIPPLNVPTKTRDQSITIEDNEMVIWQPINLSNTIGWTRISYDLHPIESMSMKIWKDNLSDGALIVGITFFLIVLFLSRPTLSLTRYTNFADQLNNNLGTEVEVDSHAIEFKRLGTALNHASRRLKQQDDDLNKLLTEGRRVALLVEHSPNVVISINHTGEIVYLNQQAKQIAARYSLTPDQLTRLLPANSAETLKSCLRRGKIRKDIESTFRDLTYLWTFSPFLEQQVVHCYAVDITERKSAQEALLQQANYDALTGLPNRSLALDRLKQAITRAHRERHLVSVMFIDLDRFKTVNDSFGHGIGDQLLVKVAKNLRNCVREGDTVARLGGDEFLVILDGIDESIHSELIAEHILDVLDRPFVIEKNEFYIGASIGIAVYPDDGENPQVLMRNADTAMYQAKENGRNNFRFFTQKLNDEAILRVKMESCLRHAIENNELHLEYQPQLCAQSGKVVSVEALVRWNNPQLHVVSPEVFIPLAEDTGLITEIGEWILTTACYDLADWLKQSPSSLRVAVNISSRQFRSSSLINSIRRILQNTGLKPHQLELEITEGLLIDDSPQTTSMLNELKMMDVTLALDDFGTGYSSLSYLKKYPFDVLKIDRSFVRDITTDPDDAAVCEAIIAIADSLGMKVVGEGVESKAQQDFLFSRGVDLIQGNYLSKPLKATELKRYLAGVSALSTTG